MNKNLLYVFADQWRALSVGYNNADILTPNIDEFAKENLTCENTYSVCPLCSPYRASLFTGKYPVNNGVYCNCMSGSDVCLNENEICLSDILFEKGYTNGYIGKWHLDEPELNTIEDPLSSAEGWDAFTPPGKKRHHFSYWRAYNASNNHLTQHYWEDNPQKIFSNVWSAEDETNKAIEFIEREKENKFALFVSFNPPHPPFDQVPKKYLDLYNDKEIHYAKNVTGDNFVNQTGEEGYKGFTKLDEITRMYYAAITGIDEQFGKIIQSLKANNLYDNTVIILTADHGEHLGSHGYVGKHTWFNESLNVPFIIRDFKNLSNHVCKTNINTVDIKPLILELLDIKEKEIAKIIDSPYEEDRNIFCSCYISRDIFIDECKKHGIESIDMGWRLIRSKKHSLVVFRGYLPDDKSFMRLYSNKDKLQLYPIELNNPKDNDDALVLYKDLSAHLRRENPGFYSWMLSFFG